MESVAGGLEGTVQNLQDQVQDLLVLAESSRRILVAPDVESIARECFAALQRIAPKAGRALYLRTEDGLDFACQLAEGCGVPKGELISVPLDVIDWVCEKRRHTMLQVPGGGMRVVLPLATRREVAGLLELSMPGGEEAFSPKLLEELQVLCGQTAAAVQNVTLLSALLRERRALGRTSAFLNNVLEGINHGIVALDAAGLITVMNRNAGSMLGVEAAQIQGRSYRELLDPEVVKVLDALVEQTRVQGFAMDQQMPKRNEQGIDLTLAVGATALQNPEGAAGVILVFRDMTATKELERLRALDQMKSQFVSNVSHELRPPLTSIKAYTEALAGMVEGEMPQKFLKVVDGEADRLLGMIEDLLNVSRIESGKFKLAWDAVDVREVVEAILAVSKVQSDRHQIVVKVDDAVPASVPMDRNKMKEVLINLVNNAVKYSPEGGEVRLEVTRQEGNLRMDVVDHGMGLSPEDQKRLFQQFFRTDQAQAAQIRGTGLGLAITKGIVEAHGGTIRVASPGVGKGSTFTVLLPIRGSLPTA